MPDKTFVFDLAGVLINWDPSPLYQRLFDNQQAKLDYFFTSVLNDQAQARISAGTPMQQVLDALATQHPDYTDAIHAWRTHWREMVIGPIGGTVAALGEIRERGYKTYALGNWAREEFDWVVDEFDFLQQFDGVLLSGDCGLLKPDEGIYQRAEQQFALQPAHTIFIDDREDNVLTAIQRGWNGIVFENPRQLYLTLMEYQLL